MKEKRLESLKLLLQKEADEKWLGKKLVFGEGNPKSAIVMIGEAPGGDEEREGRPFVGKAGKNLSEFLFSAGLKREGIYITNVVKLRPVKKSEKTGRPVNRPPDAEEISFFLPFLFEELNIIGPKLIITLGNVPLKAVFKDEGASIGKLHGQASFSNGFNVFPLYHPAAVIYNKSLKATYYEDIEKIGEYIKKEQI
ncbi:MAG: uracil-DNA glycosylase [Lachnospiraceae bacterium]|nr:uracil-DNA glycosylase [Lachnospiraceae bacterium]